MRSTTIMLGGVLLLQFNAQVELGKKKMAINESTQHNNLSDNEGDMLK